MHRILAVAAILAGLLAAFVGTTPTRAQSPVVWIGNVEETHTDTCTWVIARWSDGTDTRIPSTCVQFRQVQIRPGSSARILAAYYEQEADGCTWLVARWADDRYSAVPLVCPPGAIAVKPAVVPFASIPDKAGQIATVIGLTDGGAVDVDIAGRAGRIQLRGVTIQGAGDCFGAETAAYLTALLPAGSQILIEDAPAGNAGGLLRYVYLPDGALLNELILDLGYGKFDPASAGEQYRQAQQGGELTARFNKIGLWGVCGS